MRIRSLFNALMAVLIVIVWLMPVSNHLNTLNDSMSRNCYILNIIVLLIIFFYENKLNKISLLISTGVIVLLLTFSLIFHAQHPDISSLAWGYLYSYVPFCILINIKIVKLGQLGIWDRLLDFICILLIAVGILIVVGNALTELILRTYYVNHYAYVYTMMFLNSRKTVTFFATHSIACYLYFLIWWMLEYRNSYKYSIKNVIFMFGMFFDIVMCLSVSAVMCSLIIATYYYIKWVKSTKKKNIVLSVFLLMAVAIGALMNIGRIQSILSSNVNGLNGRFGQEGNLWATLDFALNNVVPFGICDVDGLWPTDGGFFIQFIRGGILLILLYYLGLYKFLENNIMNRSKRNFLFISLLLFEVGYQFTISLRFFMIALFLACFCRYHDMINMKLGLLKELA